MTKPTGPYGVVVEHDGLPFRSRNSRWLRGPGVNERLELDGFHGYRMADALNAAYVAGQGHPTPWHAGKPINSGYYLAAWRRTSDGPLTVSELWFNGGDGRGTWWASRGYMPNENLASRTRVPDDIKDVVAWASMPAPPEDT